MSEKLPAKNPPPLPSDSGGTATAKNSPPVVPATAPAGNVPPPAPLVAPKNSSPALFGGHKGGGKKRADGLVAGSAAAIAADKEKNAARMREARAAQRSATVPPPLPSRSSPAASPVAAQPGSEPSVRVPVDFTQGAPVVAAAGFPAFVPWVQAKLQKPAALLTKIIARSRDFVRTRQIKRLALTAEREKKILAALKWREEIVADFSQSLAECATIELNRRNVPGAEHSHYLTLAMSAGELIYQEVETSRLIESLVLEDRAEKLKATGGKTT